MGHAFENFYKTTSTFCNKQWLIKPKSPIYNLIEQQSNTIEISSQLFEFLCLEDSVIDFLEADKIFILKIKEALLLKFLSHCVFILNLRRLKGLNNQTISPKEVPENKQVNLFIHQLLEFHREVRVFEMNDYYFWGNSEAKRILKRHFKKQHKLLFG